MYKTDYEADPVFIAAQDYQSAIDWARYSQRHFLNARRNGFLMAAYEYKIDRVAYMQHARKLKPKEKRHDPQHD
jgi:hypothetical protein